MQGDVDVLIPARAGSAGLPGKNGIRLGDRSLFLHSVACAQRVEGVRRILVSTDDAVLAAEATAAGADVPELRPAHLSTGVTPMADVIRYASALFEREEDRSDGFLLLLDPTSPLRDPDEISQALARLRSFYAWRSGFARTIQPDWIDHGAFLGVETPEFMSHSIDTMADLQLVELLLTSRTVTLAWMEAPDV